MKDRLIWLEAKEGVGEETTWLIRADGKVLYRDYLIPWLGYRGSVLQDTIIKGNWVKGYAGSFELVLTNACGSIMISEQNT